MDAVIQAGDATISLSMRAECIEIDGASGEGGGQILRTSLSLSCVTGKPFRIFNIRKGREKPGIMPQHLKSVTACQRISGAQVEGAEVGSLELRFAPSSIRGGPLALDVGTAGSVCLILHAVLPPLFHTPEPASVSLRGGTHVPFSPPFHHVERVFLPALARTGRRVKTEILEWGFYPRGGGHVRAEITPPTVPSGVIDLRERGGLKRLSLLSVVAGLPLSIAERQMDQAVKVLKRGDIVADMSREVGGVPSRGNGTFFFIRADYENVAVGFSALGERGKRAEEVAREAAEEFLEFHSTDAAVEPHLADQLMVYLAVDGRGGYTTSRVTQHLVTNALVIGKFLPDSRLTVEGGEGRPGRVFIKESGGQGDGPRPYPEPLQ